MKKRSEKKGSQEIKIKPGGHASLLLSNPSQLQEALGFVAQGMVAGEACAVLAYARFNQRLAAQLRDLHGLDIRHPAKKYAVALIDGHENIQDTQDELEEFFGQARKQKRAARLLTNLGWGEAGWPDEDELLLFDAHLNDFCRVYEVAALCLYDIRQLSGRLLFAGGLQCHPTVYCHGAVHRNSFFTESSTLEKNLLQTRRDSNRLDAWLS